MRVSRADSLLVVTNEKKFVTLPKPPLDRARTHKRYGTQSRSGPLTTLIHSYILYYARRQHKIDVQYTRISEHM